MSDNTSKVARGATFLFISNIVALIVVTLHFIVLTNTLSTTEIGIIFAFQLIMYGIATLANFSLPLPIMSPMPLLNIISKILPEQIHSNNLNKAKSAFIKTLSVSIILSLIFVVLMINYTDLLERVIFENEVSNIIKIAGIQIFFFSINQFLFASLLGLNKSDTAGIFQIISLTTKYMLSAVLAYIGFGMSGVIIGYLIGDLLFTIMSLPKCLEVMKVKSSDTSILPIMKNSVYVLSSSIIIFGVTQLDRVLTLTNFGLPELSIYTIALAASTIGAYAPNSMSMALIPNLSGMLANNKIESFKITSKKYIRYISIIGFPTSFAVAALAMPLTRIFGEEYVASAVPAAILSIAVGITAFTSVYNSQLFASSRVNKILISNMIGLGIFTMIIIYTGNLLRINDFAIARAIMMIITSILISYFSYKSGFFVIDKKAIINCFTASTIMGLCLLFSSIYLNNRISNGFMIITLIPIGMLIYFLTLRVLKTFNENDLEFIERIIPLRSDTIRKILGIKKKSTFQ